MLLCLVLINLLYLEAENSIRSLVREWIKFLLYVPVNQTISSLNYIIKFQARDITSLVRWSEEIWFCSTSAQKARGLAAFCSLHFSFCAPTLQLLIWKGNHAGSLLWLFNGSEIFNRWLPSAQSSVLSF